MKIVARIVNCCQFLNACVFLLKGDYRFLVQRLLRIKMELIDSEERRELEFDCITRQTMFKCYEFFLKNVAPPVYSFVNGPLKNLFYLVSYLDMEEEQGCLFCSS